VCISCRKIENNIYPDVFWVRPPEDSSSTKIEQIRELRHQISLKPYEGRWKVFIINDADLMTEEAANCLLKTLEEPPGSSVVILVTTNIGALLPTIMSRCQVVKFEPPGQADTAFRDGMLAKFGVLAGKDADFLALASEPREKIERYIEILITFYRDGILMGLGAGSELLINPDKLADIRTLCRTLTNSVLERIVEVLYRTRLAVHANAYRKLALFNLQLEIKSLLELRESVL
jgi:DNA polymerase III delta prime subunit